MKKLNLIRASLALVLPAAVNIANASGIANSAHDWSTEAWNTGHDVCGPCHMAHGSDPNNQVIPLWSHQSINTADYRVFASPNTVNFTIRTPDGASKGCLSCHDGTLAYNQLKGQVQGAAQYVQGAYVIGGGAAHDLRGDHPISFRYMDAYNNVQTNALIAPSTPLTTTLPADVPSQTVAQLFLTGGNVNGDVQCTACHDVHRQRGESGFNSNKPIPLTPNANHNPLLVIYNVGQDGFGSALCRSCHNR